MSDWSGERDPLVAEWMVAALLLFGVAPFSLVKLCGGSWGVFAAGWVLLLLLAGLAWLGRRLWGWRADRGLRREDDEFAWASTTDNESNHERPGESDGQRCRVRYPL